MDSNVFEEKVKAMFTGDKAAFSEIYQEMKKPVFTVIFRILKNREEAEDILQDLFIRLFRQPPEGNIANPRAYIFAMARNMAISAYRKAREEESDESTKEELYESIPDNTPSPEAVLCCRVELEQAFSSLSLSERETVSLHLNAGFRFREIADMTKTPMGTVLWRYNRAIAKLRVALSE